MPCLWHKIIALKRLNVVWIVAVEVAVLSGCLESNDDHIFASLWYKNHGRIILLYFNSKYYDNIMKLIKSNFLLLVSFPQYSCTGECSIAMWRRRKKALFLFIYQFLVDLEIFLQAAQGVSSQKMPFNFGELINHTEQFN